MLDQALIQREYGFLGDHIFLNVSQVVMPPKRVQDAYNSFMADYVRDFGEDIVPKAWAIVDQARVNLAKLVNTAHPHEIAFVKNTAEGMSILAMGYPLEIGDTVVLADQEHQSTLFPWINAHQQRGIKLNIVKSVNGEIPLGDMIAKIDSRTKILVVSAAQFSTGFLADLRALGAECRKRGVLFAVDGIQALGRMVIDVQEMNIDYLVAGGNKGLLATLGAGFVYCSDRLVKTIIPPYAGYQSTVSHVSPPSVTENFEELEWYPHARRFESGNLSYNCILAISKGVELLLELGVEKIEAHVRMLEDRLRGQLKNLGLPVVEAKDPKNRSGIVCVYYPADREDQVVEILRSYRIHGTMRGGYIRFGLNFYNTPEQMDLVAEALHKVAALAGQ